MFVSACVCACVRARVCVLKRVKRDSCNHKLKQLMAAILKSQTIHNSKNPQIKLHDSCSHKLKQLMTAILKSQTTHNSKNPQSNFTTAVVTSQTKIRKSNFTTAILTSQTGTSPRCGSNLRPPLGGGWRLAARGFQQ